MSACFAREGVDSAEMVVLGFVIVHGFGKLQYIVLVVCFLLGNSPASEFYMPAFRNTLSVPSS
jgi:hypothetical protein